MSWALAAFGFGMLIILHEAGHAVAAKLVGMRVERVQLFFGSTPLRFRRGETEYGIGWIPLGGYAKISGMNPSEDLPEEVRDRAYHSQPVWKRIVVISAGPLVNLVLAVVLALFFFWQIGPQTPPPTPTIGQVSQGFPATGVLRPGDEIVAADGKRLRSSTDLANVVSSHRCAGRQVDRCRAETPVRLLVQREGKREEVALTPVFDADVVPPRPRLGFGFAFDGPRQPLPFGRAVDASFERIWFITKKTATLPSILLDAEERKQISGPVGSYEVTRQTIIDDVASVVAILAFISLSLALINLFPFLPLDGGHIFWAIVEKVRRKPVPFSVMERSGVVGFMLVLVIFVIGLTNDLGRLAGEGFYVP